MDHLAAANEYLARQHHALLDDDALIDASTGLKHATLAENNLITDETVFECAVVFDFGVVPDDASPDRHIDSNLAVGANN